MIILVEIGIKRIENLNKTHLEQTIKKKMLEGHQNEVSYTESKDNLEDKDVTTSERDKEHTDNADMVTSESL